jgi:purine/pyrimidine-nucleoside phosphorylase
MSDYKNVTAITKSNVYFDGKVVSHKIILADGSEKTLGVMMPGEYTFDTDAAEIMEVTAGEMNVLLPEASDWQIFKAGESYQIGANSQFKLKISDVCDYICSYLD